MAVEQQESDRGVLCPFCKGPIGLWQISSCGECGTFYHGECFQQNVNCSVYGCKGTAPAPVKDPLDSVIKELHIVREMLYQRISRMDHELHEVRREITRAKGAGLMMIGFVMILVFLLRMWWAKL